MSYLFVQTLVIQLFVGIAFLLLGLWGGKFLWGHDRHAVPPSSGGEGEEEGEAKADAAAREDELKRLRMLNGKLEKENQRLRKKSAVEKEPEPEPEAVAEPSPDVAETIEIVEIPEEVSVVAPKETKTDKAPRKEGPEKPEAKTGRDDLIQIRGVGKVMAKTLEKRGIRTFRQIAEWTKEEIAKLPYGSRVVRDKWQLQAKRLHKEKYGEKL